jgi:hypothetical protein
MQLAGRREWHPKKQKETFIPRGVRYSFALVCAGVRGSWQTDHTSRRLASTRIKKVVPFLNFVHIFFCKKTFLELFVKINPKTGFFLFGQLQE